MASTKHLERPYTLNEALLKEKTLGTGIPGSVSGAEKAVRKLTIIMFYTCLELQIWVPHWFHLIWWSWGQAGELEANLPEPQGNSKPWTLQILPSLCTHTETNTHTHIYKQFHFIYLVGENGAQIKRSMNQQTQNARGRHYCISQIPTSDSHWSFLLSWPDFPHGLQGAYSKM